MYESFVTNRQNTIKHDCTADKFLKSLVYKWSPLLSKWFIRALYKTVAISLFWILRVVLSCEALPTVLVFNAENFELLKI